MLVFALDTSTLQGSFGFVEINDDTPKVVTRHAILKAPADPGHAETALDRMGAVLNAGGLAMKDIDLIVFGRGPGTFTGVRIGLSTVKGVAMAVGCPIIGISSLEALALSAGTRGLVAALIDAKRHELFGALYDVSFASNGWPEAQAVMAEKVAKADDLINDIASLAGASRVFLTGNGVRPYEEPLLSGLKAEALPEAQWSPCPYWMARIGHRRFLESGPDDLDAVEPVYLRAPDARLPAVKQL